MSENRPYYCTISFARYERPRPFSKSTFSPLESFILPLPLQLFDNVGVDYATTNLETVGDIINISGASAAASIPSAILLRRAGSIINNGFDALIGAGQRRMNGPPTLGDRMGNVLRNEGAQLFNAAQIDSALQSSIGLAPNPNQAVTFQGPRLREFNFSWQFYPVSPENSATVQKFIDTCKRRSLPRSVFGSNAGVLRYPDMVQMNFYPWDLGGDPSQWGWSKSSIIRMKRCMIERVAVNYSPTNNPAFFEGTKAPVTVQVELTLKEVEYMVSDDFDNSAADASIPTGGGLGAQELEQLSSNVFTPPENTPQTPGSELSEAVTGTAPNQTPPPRSSQLNGNTD